MSPRLFSMYMDKMVRKVNARVMEKGVALKMNGENGKEWMN